MVTLEEEQGHYYLKDICNDFNKKYAHIDGVFDILKHFMYLWEEEYWELLFMVHKNWKNPPLICYDQEYADSQINDITRIKKFPESLVLMQVIKNGITPGKQCNEYSADYNAFRNLHIFLEKIQSLYLDRDLVEDDLWALHKSDVVERVLVVLDQFDVFKGSIVLKDDFFYYLQAVSWEQEVKSFFIDFNNLFSSLLFENQGPHETNFNLELNNVLVLLSHSCALWADSPQIHTEHVIKAYKTLFKIITTDITLLVDKKYYTGQLVCEECREVYSLLEDEAPYDFSQCSCGGDLNYIDIRSRGNENNK